MSRTKTIYFLSAFVLIIGCFALNKSYSLFTATAKSEVIEAPVPKLEAYLTIGNTTDTSIEIDALEECLVQLKVTNPSNTSVNYGIKTNSTSTNYTVRSVTDGTNIYLSYGNSTTNNSLKANTDLYTYIVIKNNEENPITVNFELVYSYSTIILDVNESTNINNDNLYTVSLGGLPYSDKPTTLTYKIIENFVNSDLYSGSASGSDISSLFNENALKVSLPLETSGLDVPSPTEFTDIEENEVGLYKAEDDYGTSYYFRGESSVNYVKFAGFIWRIVRINGDGSVRLILEDVISNLKDPNDNTKYVYQNDALLSVDNDGLVYFPTFVSNPDLMLLYDITYAGYMHGNTKSKNYTEAHKNINNSNIKKYVDAFYKEYLISNLSYIEDTIFCGDKTRNANTQTHNNEYMAYAAMGRIGEYPSMPTLKCAPKNEIVDTGLSDEELAYSRYTVERTSIINGKNIILTNNDLTYPIALLSVDELVMSGVKPIYNNTNWWTMTPNYCNSMLCQIYGYNAESYNTSKTSYNTFSSDRVAGVRPVINLKLDVLWDKGDGTDISPYEVKLPE